jgi:hypothetical protein
VLAGIEEALQTAVGKSQEEMTAVETLIAGLFDYAGLYPPASLDMQTAVRNYLQYSESAQRGALGRFVVSVDRIDEVRSAAGASFSEMKLSLLVAADADLGPVSELLSEPGGVTLECKANQVADIERVCAQLPAHTECYFEIPMAAGEELLDAIKANGARAKLRMGGVVAEAFPAAKSITVMLQALAERHLAFKATAGLHHPIRSRHPFTYASNSAAGTMHGFLNLAFAATLLHFGGTAGEALHILEEEDPGAWRVSSDAIQCRAFRWTIDQLREMREQFFISIGSCSFEEPMRDLELLGWL